MHLALKDRAEAKVQPSSALLFLLSLLARVRALRAAHTRPVQLFAGGPSSSRSPPRPAPSWSVLCSPAGRAKAAAQLCTPGFAPGNASISSADPRPQGSAGSSVGASASGPLVRGKMSL